MKDRGKGKGRSSKPATLWDALVEDAKEHPYDPESGSFRGNGGPLFRRLRYIPVQPWDWYKTACRLPGKSVHVAGLIRLQVSLRRNPAVELDPQILKECGITRSAAYRAVTALEAAGLVRVERSHTQKLRITVLGGPDPQVPGRSG